MAKLNFQHHYGSLQCHMILQKSEIQDLLMNGKFKKNSIYLKWKSFIKL